MFTTTSGSHDPISKKIDQMSNSHGSTAKYALTQYRVVRSISYSEAITRTPPLQREVLKMVDMAMLVV